MNEVKSLAVIDSRDSEGLRYEVIGTDAVGNSALMAAFFTREKADWYVGKYMRENNLRNDK